MKQNSILEITDLSFGYTKEKLIYKNFSLILNKGEIISIVGESGSGKTTLFELISNTLKPISGDIQVKKISSIYQDPYSSFHPSYSILNQINDTVKKLDLKELNYYANELQLDISLLNKKPHKLSGGQLQRASILRAILMKPDLILADEPTSALDNIIALQTMQLLIKFLDKVGILLITHDEDLASWCSNKIVRLNML